MNVEYYKVCFAYNKPNGERVNRQNELVTIILDEDKLPNCNHDEAQSIIEMKYKDCDCIIREVNLHEFKN